MKIYICREYGGKDENRQIVEDWIRYAYLTYGSQFKEHSVTFVSPIHAFGFMYNMVEYEEGIRYCLELLNECDLMVTFGSWSMSRGCMIEKEMCRNKGIPIIEEHMILKHGMKAIQIALNSKNAGIIVGNGNNSRAFIERVIAYNEAQGKKEEK